MRNADTDIQKVYDDIYSRLPWLIENIWYCYWRWKDQKKISRKRFWRRWSDDLCFWHNGELKKRAFIFSFFVRLLNSNILVGLWSFSLFSLNFWGFVSSLFLNLFMFLEWFGWIFLFCILLMCIFLSSFFQFKHFSTILDSKLDNK